jgi:hypothetical protein
MKSFYISRLTMKMPIAFGKVFSSVAEPGGRKEPHQFEEAKAAT